MPRIAFEAVTDFDRHFRRAVWITALITSIGAAMFYVDKADDDRSAFVRWHPQVLRFWAGENIYETAMFPNPPIFPISLYPFARLPKVEGAVSWYVLRLALTTLAIWLCFRLARRDGTRTLPSWVQGPVILLSLRPILSDLQHGSNNLVILFLIVATLYSWRKGYDVLAGLLLALAISFKVTPALFVPYFMYKRSWRIVGSTCLGMVLFIAVVPTLILGPSFNILCLKTWASRMLSPFLVKGFASPQEMNQSVPGVLTRLLTDTKTGEGRYDVHLDLNVVSWSPLFVKWLVRGVGLAVLGTLAWLCRTSVRRRDDPRLLGEFALVVLAMLFLSERSWKHHYVTLLLPYTYLMYRVGTPGWSNRVRIAISSGLFLSALLMASTSSELGGQVAAGGHKIAQGYGMFLWAGVVLYILTAWRVWVEKNDSSDDNDYERPVVLGQSSPAPHWTERRRPLVSD